MKRVTFLHGVLVAFTFAVLGAITFLTLEPAFGPALVLRGLIAALGGAYVVYLVARSDEKSGRLAVPAAWTLGAIAIAFTQPSMTLYLLAHAGMVWLVRSLYFHSGLIAALLDLGLCTAGVFAAIAAARSSNSVFLAVWSFFLVQALFVAIPAFAKPVTTAPATSADDRFHRALASAEAALRRYHTTR